MKRFWVPLATAAGLFGAVTSAGAAQAATAYTVEPLNFNLVESTANLFDGAVCEVYTCRKVPTPAALDLSYRNGVFGENGPISEGAAALNARLVADPGDKVVFGYSQGAQIANFWLRNYAPTAGVDPGTTSFLLVGDPENTYGVPWTPNVPADTGYHVTEIWSQYDGWADWPTRFTLLAVANAVAGMFLSHPVVYDHLDLDAERAAGNVVSWRDGGVDYQMVRNDRLPLLTPLHWVGLGAVAEALDAPLRAQIEASYDRPSSQPQADGFVARSVAPAAAAADVAARAARAAVTHAPAAIRTRQPAVRAASRAEAPRDAMHPARTTAKSRGARPGA